MTSCEIHITTPDGQQSAGVLSLSLYEDQIELDPAESALLQRIVKQNVLVDGGTDVVSSDDDPEKWLRALPQTYSGTYLRAEFLDHPANKFFKSNPGHAGRPGQRGDSAPGAWHPQGGVGGRTSLRAELARKSFKPATFEKQALANRSARQLGKALGLEHTDDSMPFDLVKGNIGVEVKCLIDAKNDKCTMHPDSRRRKLAFAKRYKLKMFTVVIDKRGASAKYFWNAGVGSFRISAMQRAASINDLKAAIR